MTPSSKLNGKRTTIVATAVGSVLAGACVWAATLVARVNDVAHIERRQQEQALTLRALPDKYVPRCELMTALRNIEQRLQRIENKLDHVNRTHTHGLPEQ